MSKISNLRQNVGVFASELSLQVASKDLMFAVCSSQFNGKNISLKIGKGPYKKYVQKEIKIIRMFSGVKGFPTFLFVAETADGTAIIGTEKLGNSLHEIRLSKAKKFNLATIAMIGVSITYRLEALHKKGIVHGGICPMNILSGLKRTKTEYELFLVNYENSTECTPDLFRSNTNGFMTVENMDFAPKVFHRSRRQNPKDDFESLIYTLAFLKNGKLPWSKMPKENSNQWKRIGMAKEKVKFEDLFDEKHEILQLIYQIISSLKGERCPCYSDIRTLFRKILTANNVSNEKDFAWLD